MNPLEEIEPNDKGSYANASVLGRVVTIFAGPLANYLFASVFFFFAFVIGGKTVGIEPYIDPLAGRPAAVAGMQTGDRVVEVAGVAVSSWEEMAEQISRRPDKPTKILVERGGERMAIEVTPANEGGKGRIGVGVQSPAKLRKVSLTAKESVILAINQPPVVVKNLIVGLGELFTGKAKSDLHGPIKIVQEMSDTAKSGFTDLLSLLGMLSAYLGAFNLIPFPALDGGRLVFLGYEAATRRRANQHIETVVHFVGFVMLFGLMIYVTVFKDILGAK
jgi:regulator of sigma E protease